MNDDRDRSRHAISVPGRYRTGTGVAKDVDILDISESGCRFFDRFGRMIPGTVISIRIDTIGPIVATVRWCEANIVGIQFENPLYGPVFEHIRAKLDRRDPLTDDWS